MEYLGEDFDADMAKMAADPKTKEWWAIMEPMQQPVKNRKEGEWWANMEEVFHLDWIGYSISMVAFFTEFFLQFNLSWKCLD